MGAEAVRQQLAQQARGCELIHASVRLGYGFGDVASNQPVIAVFVQQRAQIAQLHEHLSDSARILGNTDPALDRTLGWALGLPLGRILGSDGIRAVYPEAGHYLPRPDSRELDPARPRRTPLGDAAVQFATERSTFILKRLLQAIDLRLVDLLEDEAAEKDRGGAPTKRLRNEALIGAAYVYRMYIGEPTSTEGGIFETFCSGILGVLDIDVTGLNYAIKKYCLN